jgi:hypothetical protein
MVAICRKCSYITLSHTVPKTSSGELSFYDPPTFNRKSQRHFSPLFVLRLSHNELRGTLSNDQKILQLT